MGKGIYILLAGSIILLSTKTYDTSLKLNEARREAVNHYSQNQSRNICNSMVGMIMSTIADTASYTVTTPQSKNIFNGIANYTVTKALLPGITDSVFQINVTAAFFDDTNAVEVFVRSPAKGFIPSPVKAAISTNNPVSTLGNLTVDGRDHDISGNLISNNGTLGIWSTGAVNQSGNSKIGSTTSAGTDIAPKNSADSDTNIVQQGQVWPGGYPDSPDKVLGGTSNGFPSGTLKGIAQSGINGSQYVTDPSSLSYPLKGITYVELPGGGEWKPVDITGSGILIVHNSALDAKMKNLNSGSFVGMVIADDIIHVHADIIGAVVGLSPSPSDGNCIGNGNGNVLFSRRAIEKATGAINNSGNGNNFGFARQRVEVVHWYE
jgi:hypothetical protein